MIYKTLPRETWELVKTYYNYYEFRKGKNVKLVKVDDICKKTDSVIMYSHKAVYHGFDLNMKRRGGLFLNPKRMYGITPDDKAVMIKDINVSDSDFRGLKVISLGTGYFSYALAYFTLLIPAVVAVAYNHLMKRKEALRIYELESQARIVSNRKGIEIRCFCGEENFYKRMLDFADRYEKKYKLNVTIRNYFLK